MILLPGVIDSTTNYVEHPEVIADRITQVVEAVGDRTRVIASVDCGFGTFAGSEAVAPSIVWSKLRALREGAKIATERLWLIQNIPWRQFDEFVGALRDGCE